MRVDWRPDHALARPHACSIPPPRDLATLLDLVRRTAARLGVPVQALRADRVVCASHLAMAHVHAHRARIGRRARASDPAIEFLLFAATSRQIHEALAALGHDDADAVPMVLVALPDTPTQPDLVGAVRAAGHEASPWTPDPAARVWWAERIGLGPDADTAQVEAAVLGAMAALAVAKQ